MKPNKNWHMKNIDGRKITQSAKCSLKGKRSE